MSRLHFNSTGTYIPASRLLLKLAEEADGVPIIFAIVASTGHVLLEEFSDTAVSIPWENPLKKEFVFEGPLSVQEEHARCKSSRKRKLKGTNGSEDNPSNRV
jgi:hypothetical protein